MEQKIMAKIFSRISVDQQNPSMFSLVVAEISRDTNSVRKALDKLTTRSFLVPDETGKKKDWTIPLIGEKYYHTGKGTIDVELNAKFMEIMRLVKSSDGYTKYALSASLSFRSKYSQPLFELLSKWHDKSSITISIEQLQFMMGCKGMIYSQFHDRCLKPAIRELNDKTDLQIDYQQVRQGRTIVNIILNYRTKSKLAKQQAAQETRQIEKQIDEMSPGEMARVAGSLTRDYDFAPWQHEKIMSNPKLFKQFAVLDNLIVNGDIKDVRDKTRYMAASLFHPKRKAS